MSDVPSDIDRLIVRFDRLQNAIDAEMSLVVARINGLLLFEGILFAAFVQALRISPRETIAWLMIFLAPVLGIAVALMVQAGVRAGTSVIGEYKIQRAALSDRLHRELAFERLGVDLDDKRHRAGMAFARETPMLLVLAWTFLTIAVVRTIV